MDAAVSAAREKLKNVTPLKKDCGRFCGAGRGELRMYGGSMAFYHV